jgi:hypothetical protein
MTDIAIDLLPDPARDTQARRAALSLVTATLYDAEEDEVKELSSAALQDLVEQVVGEIGGVREESKPALQLMLTAVARQYSAFTGVAYAFAAEAFLAGQRDPMAEEPDFADLLSRVRRAVETPEQG